MSRAALVSLLALQTGVSLHAQTATAEVNGTITDKSGGVVADAAVKLTNMGTKVSDQTRTNGKGYYVSINVQPAAYLLSIEATGFKRAESGAAEPDRVRAG
jgi:hypothetical protein